MMENYFSGYPFSTSLRKLTSILFCITVFIYMLMQMRCWIGFDGRTLFYGVALAVLLPCLEIAGLASYVHQKRNLVFSILIFIFIFYHGGGWTWNIFGAISHTVLAVVIYYLLSTPDEEKDYILSVFIKWLGVIMSISMIIYILIVVVGAHLPNLGIIYADYGFRNLLLDVPYRNYFFYILPINEIGNAQYGFVRFNGPLLEPGDVGCGCAFLLFAARFQFKRYKMLWAIALSVVMSFSLAGYVLTAMGYLLIMLFNEKLKVRTVVLLCTIASAIYSFGVNYNNGNNFLNEAIFSRFQYDEDRGFSGNNRNSIDILDLFNTSTRDIEVFLFGRDRKFIDSMRNENNSIGDGFVQFFVSDGLLGTILAFIPYLFYSRKTLNKRYSFLFLIFFVLFFYQRVQIIWIIYVLSFVYGTVIADNDKFLEQTELSNG